MAFKGFEKIILNYDGMDIVKAIRVIMKNADKLLLLAHLFGNNGNIFTNLLYF